MFMTNVIKANKGIIKKVLVYGGGLVATAAIALVVIARNVDTQEMIPEGEEVIEVEMVEVETEKE